MKIPLSQNELADLSSTGDIEAFRSAIDGSRLGDWDAKRQLDRFFNPLIQLLVFKRAGNDTARRNELAERAREGLHRAAKRFPRDMPARRFWIFALDPIESAMDRPTGRLMRLLGRQE